MNVFNPQIIQQSFSDFDELADAAQGWNLELCKLDAVPFLGEIFQIITPDFILSRAQFNSRVKQSGEPPAGLHTFAIPATESYRTLWRAQPITENDLMIFPAGGELHSFSNPGFDVFTLSVTDHLLEQFVEVRKFKGKEVLHCNPVSMNRLRQLLHQITQQTERIETLKIVLLHQLAQLMAEASHTKIARTPHRIQTILHAERFILTNPGEVSTVNALCTATGVSKRTLEYAFSNHLGICPKTYLNAVRLNAVHRQLRGAQPGEIHVADAANHWGFWHMGQFAADYRKLFGQNPSVTLGCDAQPCKATCPFRGQCQLCRA